MLLLIMMMISSLIIILSNAIVSAEDVVCSGNFYFRATEVDKPDIYFPPSNITCDIINGTLSFSGYSSKYLSYIPTSMKSIKVINGYYSITGSQQYPQFNNNNEVNYKMLDKNIYKDVCNLK